MAKIWQLSANYSGVDVKGTINGFPVFDGATAGSGESGFATAPLNPFLIGKGNVLRIEVTAKADGGKLSCSVEDAMTGDIVDTGNAAEIPLPDGDPPHVIEQTFDSEMEGFAKLLAEAKPSDEASMVAFALKLRDMLNAGDKDGVLALFKPKFEAISADFGQPIDMIMGQAGQMVAAFTSAKHEFESGDVDARPHCDNKLWELKHKNGHALIRIEEDGGSMSLDVCAAQMPGGIEIVR